VSDQENSPQPIPVDDRGRGTVQVSAEGQGVRHLAVVGDTYTVLVSGKDTAGRYTLIDMPETNATAPSAPSRVRELGADPSRDS
jgi:hypothetical protein